MVKLANVGRSTWARLLVIIYIAAHVALTFLKMVKTLCVLALVVLCAWDQLCAGLDVLTNHGKITTIYHERLQAWPGSPWKPSHGLAPLQVEQSEDQLSSE